MLIMKITFFHGMEETVVLIAHKNLSCVETNQSFPDPFSQLCSVRQCFLSLTILVAFF